MDEVYVNKKELPRWIAKRFKNDLISISQLISEIEDLESDVERLERELEELKQDIEDNYRPIPKHEQYEVYDDDFI